MKFSTNVAAFKKPLKNIEIFSLVIFIIFLLFPFRIPTSLAKLINNPIGILLIFFIIIFLFVKAHIIVAILYLLVAYEMIRRSGKKVSYPVPTTSGDSQLKMHNLNGDMSGDMSGHMNNINQNYNDNYNTGSSILNPGANSLSSLNANTNLNPINSVISNSASTVAPLPVYTMNPNTSLYNYASIGIDSRGVDRDAELERINPNVYIGSTLEEQMILERIPPEALHTNTYIETTSYTPIYDTTAYDVSAI